MIDTNSIVQRFEVDSDDFLSLFISSFETNEDKEIVSIIGAWVSNDKKEDANALKHIVYDIMREHPYDYILSYDGELLTLHSNNESLYGMLTYGQLDNLLHSLHEIYGSGESNIVPSKKVKYGHDILLRMFGVGCGFQTKANNSTFYRLNLLLYLLTYKHHIWGEVDTKMVLLPCNDRIFEQAFKQGITKKPLKPNLRSAVALTKMAKDMFGEKDFYKLYEFLNFADR